MKRILLCLALCLVGCGSHDRVIRVAASPVPHAEILEAIEPDLAEKGIRLKIVEVDDYQLPNRLLHEKQVDANFFQHQPFLDLQNREFGYHLVPLVKVHLEPLGIYSTRVTSLKKLPHGARLAIPSDPTNEARALKLLQNQGLITLKDLPLATSLDIVKNPKNLRFVEVEAFLLPRVLPDVDAAVIPANFALQAGFAPEKDALALESKDSPYANLLVVREGDEGREELQTLAKLLTSDKVRAILSKRGLILIENK